MNLNIRPEAFSLTDAMGGDVNSLTDDHVALPPLTIRGAAFPVALGLLFACGHNAALKGFQYQSPAYHSICKPHYTLYVSGHRLRHSPIFSIILPAMLAIEHSTLSPNDYAGSQTPNYRSSDSDIRKSSDPSTPTQH